MWIVAQPPSSASRNQSSRVGVGEVTTMTTTEATAMNSHTNAYAVILVDCFQTAQCFD